MMTQISRLPRFVWNLLVLFFAGWFAVAGWLLWGGDDSPVVRFTFALCGGLGLYTGALGGMSRSLASLLRKRSVAYPLCGATVVLLVIAASTKWIFIPFREGMRGYMQTGAYRYHLAQEGASLIAYAEKHDGRLPHMFRNSVYRSIQRYSSPRSSARPDSLEAPFLWQGELSGLYTKDFSNPQDVIMAHSQEISCYRTYAVLYLDGRIDTIERRDKLRYLLRKQAPLIAEARDKQAKREKKNKVVP